MPDLSPASVVGGAAVHLVRWPTHGNGTEADGSNCVDRDTETLPSAVPALVRVTLQSGPETTIVWGMCGLTSSP